MSEASITTLPARRSPFDGHPVGAHPNAAGQTGVRLQAGMLASVTQVSTWISGVHGLEHLYVVDASVFPTVTSGNTHAPTTMVAHKGADAILRAQA